jgi:trimeric autotransporter adhesin
MAILSVGPTSTYPSIAAAMLFAAPSDTIQLEAGYSNETATVSQSGMIVTGDASSTGIILQLAVGVSAFAAGGTAPIAIMDASDANAITGNAGDNLITVTAGVDSVDGGLGVDRLVVDYRLATGAVTGTAAHFTEAGGGARSVTLTAATIEHFTVLTGGGADTLTVADGDNIISSGLGADTVTVGDGNNNIDVGGGANTVTAGNGANIVTGGDDADTITALDGGNHIDAGDGVNIITSGAGEDTILSGTGADTIISGGGTDLVTITGGLDAADLGGGDDRLILDYAAMLTDVTGGITGGGLAGGYTGHIADLAGSVIDFVATENFTITTGSGADAIITGDGMDVINGDLGNDTLTAGGGNDQLDGGGGADSMVGGAGKDTYLVDDVDDVVVELVGGGYDRVAASIDWTLGNDVEWLSLRGAADLNGTGNELANRIDGNRGANILDGGDGNDVLSGGAGNDTLIGGAGGDFLNGGQGADSMTGGTSDDTYLVDDLGDVVVELPGGGYDRVNASLDWTLGDELERLSLSGTADLNGTGNGLDNQMDGNAGANILDGGDGNDALFGFDGADTLIGGAGADSLVGGLGADSMTGGVGADSLDGGLGADAMVGGAGNDTYLVDDLGDVVVEQAGGGYDRVGASINWTLSAEVERLSLRGAADLNGTGNELANQIDGNRGVNILDGGDGNDVLIADAGNDTLIGGAGADFLNGGQGADSMTGGLDADRFFFGSAAEANGDVIADFSAAQGDMIDLRPIDTSLLLPGDQSFAWIDGASFNGVAGELRFAGGMLEGDLDGNAVADFQIALEGVATLSVGSIWL